MSDRTKKRIDEDIERYRKGDIRLRITDREGAPLEKVSLHIRQKEHAFRFGGNLFMLDEFETEEKNAAYREKFPFNLATLPFYWNSLEPEPGAYRFTVDSPRRYRRPPIDLCLTYCKERAIEPKVHCLHYKNANPHWLYNRSVEEEKRATAKRFRVLSERYADIIPSWEVTNEHFDLNVTQNSRLFFEPDYTEWCFRMADRYFPANRLIINDYIVWDNTCVTSRTPYYLLIERLLRNGVSHLDSIGFQYHGFFPKIAEAHQAMFRYHPDHLLSVLDDYWKAFGKSMQITEMTIPAYSDSQEDEEVQAELLKHIYTLFFSHPAMEAIIYWNLVDGYAAYAPQGDMTAGENVYYGGLLRFDLSEKPAYRMLRHLTEEVWHTECDITPSPTGEAVFRGFYGDYEITVKGADGTTHTETVSATPTGTNQFTIRLS